MSGNNEDLALLLEADTLELIRIQGIFLVLSIAIFSFSSKGKIFSIISLLISFIFNVTLVINYYMVRNRIADLGFFPKRITDIIVFVMVIVAIFTLWILYEVWNTPPPISLSKIAEDIEIKIDESNKINEVQINENLRQIDENRKLIESLNGTINGNKRVKKESLTRSLNQKEDITKIIAKDQSPKLSRQTGLLKLENASRNESIINDSALAMVS